MSADWQQMNSKAIDPVAQVDPALVHELAQEMVQALNLDVTAEQIDPKAPLYGDGLGLDSIDILEVALVVSRKYGFQLRANDEGNVRIFSSLESLARHVASHRTK
jgi:acyl carrier protein